MARILVVDDERQILRNILEVLEFEGFDAVGADNGRVGIDMARQISPDLILCDIMMPEADGFEVIQTLRADPQTRDIPIVMMSAKVDRDTVRMVMVEGASDYLSKPFTMPDLLAAVRKHLGEPEP
jgi:CheY-like chemotaxis protein